MVKRPRPNLRLVPSAPAPAPAPALESLALAAASDDEKHSAALEVVIECLSADARHAREHAERARRHIVTALSFLCAETTIESCRIAWMELDLARGELAELDDLLGDGDPGPVEPGGAS